MSVSASSIVAAIDGVEARLAIRIFDRRRATGVQITPAGQRFVAAARHLLAAEADFIREVGELQAGTQSIRIGCFEPFGALFMAEGLARFRKEAGATDVSVFEGNQVQLSEWLSRGVVDVVIAYDIGPRFPGYATPICRVPAHALVSSDHPLAAADRLSLRDLAPHPMVLLDLPLTNGYVLSLFEDRGLKPRVGFRARSYATVGSAVAAGFGFAVLNMRPLDRTNLDTDHLIRVPLVDADPTPILQIADLYGPLKSRQFQMLEQVFLALFREGDPERFAVVTPEQRPLLFEV